MSETKNTQIIVIAGLAVAAYFMFKKNDTKLADDYQRAIYNKTLPDNMSYRADSIDAGVPKNDNPANKPPNDNLNPVKQPVNYIEHFTRHIKKSYI